MAGANVTQTYSQLSQAATDADNQMWTLLNQLSSSSTLTSQELLAAQAKLQELSTVSQAAATIQKSIADNLKEILSKVS